jgi:hypothetical protein
MIGQTISHYRILEKLDGFSQSILVAVVARAVDVVHER